uniref:Prolactin regulatory element binding n=1 Tax=Eptatretus burgeri TaxID=7764 RepID=A0A8C4QC03_EPTBU
MAPVEIYRAPFPLYSLRFLEPGLIVVAGGGGAARTGIKNALHFLRLECIGGHLSASLLHCHDTGLRAVMNLALARPVRVLAVGMDGYCQLLSYQEVEGAQTLPSGQAKGSKQQEKPGRHKRRQAKMDENHMASENKDETPLLEVKSQESIQTDFSSENLQKVVRFNSDCTILATGGVDGYLRTWKYPSLKPLCEVLAHHGEIEDLDFAPDNKVVTAGRDFACSVWQHGILVAGLDWSHVRPDIPSKTYRFQGCRFARVEDSNEVMTRLFTVHIPHRRERHPLPCFLTKWDANNFLPLLNVACGNEVISALAVSEVGTYLGLGTITGSVAIHIAFSLQRVYYVRETHGIVVTELGFLPSSTSQKSQKKHLDAELLSVSLDSRCKLHVLPTRSEYLLLCFLCGSIDQADLLLCA